MVFVCLPRFCTSAISLALIGPAAGCLPASPSSVARSPAVRWVLPVPAVCERIAFSHPPPSRCECAVCILFPLCAWRPRVVRCGGVSGSPSGVRRERLIAVRRPSQRFTKAFLLLYEGLLVGRRGAAWGGRAADGAKRRRRTGGGGPRMAGADAMWISGKNAGRR